eukprot:s209_g33.t1
MTAIKFKILPRSVLQALPPEMPKLEKMDPAKCPHAYTRRYGNMHGSFAKCQQCNQTFKWNKDTGLWDHHGSKGHSLPSRHLPPPSSETISVPAAKPKTAPSSSTRTSRTSRPKAYPEPVEYPLPEPYQWTIYPDSMVMAPHLTEDQRMEVFNIISQEDPRNQEPQTWEQHAFLTEDVFQEARDEIAMRSDQHRRERLMELGVLPTHDHETEEFYDWSTEIQICNVNHKSRQPQAADLWELFAGEATCSRLAHQYQLNALQPFDLIYGQNFMDEQMRNSTIRALRRHQPHLLMIELECTHYNIFNKNMNYSTRLDEWQMLQDQQEPLLDLSVDSAMIQYQAGRFFLLENPLRSQVWSKPRVEELRHLPGVWEVVLDLGAFGATNNDGDPIQKPLRLIGNMPGLDVVLHQRLSQDDKALCVPVQGKHTRNSQVYPEQLCRAILKHLQDYVRSHYPDRFCTAATAPHVALPVQQPTADLTQWDDIVKAVDAAFENTSKRPYYIMPDSPQGKHIQDLLRLDATRIQVVSTPSTRRLPNQFFDYVIRATFVLYNDDSRAVEVENLDEMQFPRQRFAKPVRIGIFVYGHPRPEDGPDQQQDQPMQTPAIMPGLPTDIDFPGISTSITQEVKSAIARLHLNMGHPSKEELCRMMAQQGNIPDAAFECARKLRCATCERLRPPQAPRPSTTTKPFMGQFGDEIQMDVVFCRTLTSQTFMVLGAVDRATGLHQAALLPDRNASTTFETFEQMWLKPYGLPLRVICDPDTSFRGEFQLRLQALGVNLEHCPPEAHYVIGAVERRNAVFRLILEKMIDQFGVQQVDQCPTLIMATCHALNSGIRAHGRSAYQAARSLAKDESNKGSRLAPWPEMRLLEMAEERTKEERFMGHWALLVMGSFSCWQASVDQDRLYNTLVTAEQLRAAFGFEQWSPDEQDVQALKDASTSFHKQIMDERGPQPSEQELHPLPEDLEISALDDPYPMTPAMMVPATPEPEAVQQPQLDDLPPEATAVQLPTNIQQQFDQQTLQQSIHIHSPTNIQHVEQHYRFGAVSQPRAPARARSRTPSHRGHALSEQHQQKAQTPRQDQHDPTTQSQHGSAQQSLEQQAQHSAVQQQPLTPAASASMQAQSHHGILPPTTTTQVEQQQAQASTQQQGIPFHDDTSLGIQQPFIDPTEVITIQDDEPQPPPEKMPRLHETLMIQLSNVTMYVDCDGNIKHLRRPQDPATWQCFGSKSTRCYQAYLMSDARKKDVQESGKEPEDPDTSDDSDESEAETSPDHKTPSPIITPLYKQGLSRQELKAMDREIPWRSILSMPEPYVEKFIEAVNKEASSWAEWQSVEPLSDEQARQIYDNKELRKRIIPARACYRDKSCGVGDLRAKCRIVALGHLDPDLAEINRSSGTPGRVSEHMIFVMMTAGFNRELFGTKHPWKAWSADAATAFLQGQQSRRSPIFLKPPNDGLIQLTNHWKAQLYRVRGNIYGLADAPATWAKEVIGRLTGAQYHQHSFDQQVFYKIVNGEIVSIILVYVDDFIGLFRSDYDLGEIHALFRWGSITYFEENKPVTFKGKELTMIKRGDRFQLKITMTSFINSLGVGTIRKGRLQQDQALTPDEQKELRSVSGCLQWVSTQCRPEVSAVVSLTGHGSEATINDLRNLYAIIRYLKSTPDDGLIIPDIPFNESTVVLGYSDSSWANARKSGSQIGVIICLTTENAEHSPTPASVVDWRSCRSPRVCRSTLAAEATAADEAADRAAFVSMFGSEFLFQQPAHRVGARMPIIAAVDAKSLYDALLSPAPNLNDKRTLVSVRAVQETLASNDVKWVPTRFQFADGLTKVDKNLMLLFRQWLKEPTAILKETQASIQWEQRAEKEKETHESFLSWWIPGCGVCAPAQKAPRLPCAPCAEGRGEILDCGPLTPAAAAAEALDEHAFEEYGMQVQDELSQELEGLMRLCSRWTAGVASGSEAALDMTVPPALQAELRSTSRPRRSSSRESDESRERACLLCEGTAFQKVVRLDASKLKVSSTEGIKLLVQTLGGVWGQSKLETKYERFEKALYGTVQKNDETHTSYVARHEVQFEELLSMGTKLEEMRAYVLLRNSGLSSEDKKRIIIDSGGSLEYAKVISSLQLLGSRFFAEVQTGGQKSAVRTKTYDVLHAEDAEHEGDEIDESVLLSFDQFEDPDIEAMIAEGDSDALTVYQFEEALIESLQNDSEVATCLNAYVEARKRITEKVKGRGFWVPSKNHKGKSKGKSKGGFKNKFRRPLAQRIMESTCRLCNQPGHWKAECPLRNKSSSNPPGQSSAFAGMTIVESPHVEPSVNVEGLAADPNGDDCDVPPPDATAFVAEELCFMTISSMPCHDKTVSKSIKSLGAVLSKCSRHFLDRLPAACRNVNFPKTDRTCDPLRKDQDVKSPCHVLPGEIICFALHGTRGIVDLGASTSVIGQQQFSELCRALPGSVKNSMKESTCSISFRFGNDSTVVGKRSVFFPVGHKWIRVVVVPSNTPFLIANSVFRSLGAVIDTQANVIFFKELNRSVPIQITERKLYHLDLLDLLTPNSGVQNHAVQATLTAVVDESQVESQAKSDRSMDAQFDMLAERLRRVSLNEEAHESLEQIMAMQLPELKECTIQFGKTYLGRTYESMIPETKYMTWFAETYKDSKKPQHVKFLRFIQLRVEELELKHAEVKKTLQAKSKAAAKSKMSSPPIDLESDEEVDVSWDQVPDDNALEMMTMQNRMAEMEGARAQGLWAERHSIQDGDLDRQTGRFRLYDRLLKLRPRHIWLAPRCRAWCRWNVLNMQKSPELAHKIMQDRQDDQVHLQLCDAIFEFQTFRHSSSHAHLEQPAGSEMLYQEEMERLLSQAWTARCDMCTAGKLRHPVTSLPLQKGTQIVTTSQIMYRSLDVLKCDHQHEHDQVAGSFRDPKLGRINVSQYTELYTRVFATKVARKCSKQVQERSKSCLEDALAVRARTDDGEKTHNKRPKLNHRKQSDTSSPQQTSEHPMHNFLQLSLTHAPKVGKRYVTQGAVFQHAQQLFPEYQLHGLELCKGADRLRTPPVELSSQKWPLRFTLGIKRDGTGYYMDEHWEEWGRMTRKNLIRNGTPSRLMVTLFARLKPSHVESDPSQPASSTDDPPAKRQCVRSNEYSSEPRVEEPVSPEVSFQELVMPKPSPEITSEHPEPSKNRHGPKFMMLSSEERQQLLRMHHNLGHPDAVVLGNVLRDQGWPQEAIDGIRDMHCSACFERQQPRLSRPSHLGAPRSFNDVVAMDAVTWTSDQGPMKHLLTDSAGEFCSEEFCTFLQGMDIQGSAIAGEAHWQLGRCERHGWILQTMLDKYQQSQPITNEDAFEQALQSCCAAKNSLSRHRGYSPEILVLGKSRHVPASNMNDHVDSAQLMADQASENDPSQWTPEIQWFMQNLQVREAARSAFVKADHDMKLRRSLLRRQRPSREQFVNGQWVMYWRAGKGNAPGSWRGPARIIMTEYPNVIWLTHMSRLYRCAPEHVRALSEREDQDVRSGALSEPSGFPMPEGTASQLGSGVFQYHDLHPGNSNQNQPNTMNVHLSQNHQHSPGNPSPPEIVIENNGPVTHNPNPDNPMPNVSPPVISDNVIQPDSEPDAASPMPNPETPHVVPAETTVVPNPVEVPVPDTSDSDSEDCLQSWHDGEKDTWEVSGNQLVRWHVEPRLKPFFPTDSLNCPIPCEWLEESRETRAQTLQGFEWNHHDTWRNNIKAHQSFPSLWTGKTLFTIKTQHREQCPTQQQYIHMCQAQPIHGYEMEIILTVEDLQRCGNQNMEDQIAFLASSAKKQRSEVREKDLTPSDRVLFQGAKAKEIASWLSTETVRRIARSQIPEEQILRARWVLTWKPQEPSPHNPDAPSHKPKARLVILGYEDPNLESMARDSPTMGKDSRTLILQYAASAKWRIRSFDIQTAFLRGSRNDGRLLGMDPPIEMREYMKLQPWECCELRKSAYGLCNAPLLWYEELKAALLSLNFVISPLDPCAFALPRKDQKGIHGIVGVHVDDGLGAGDETFNKAIAKLEERYPFGSKMEGEFVFTGIHVKQFWDGRIELDQTKYIEDITPIEIERSRRAQHDEVITEKERQALRALVGSIQYAATNTRPDLSAKLSLLQAKINSAQVRDLLEGNKLLQEAKQFKDTKITIQSIPLENLRFVSFSDASFATRANSQSQKGCLILAASKEIGEWQSSMVSPLIWYSRKIARVVGSTLASETYALSGSVDLLSWLRIQWSWFCQPSELWKDPEKCLSECPEAFAIVDCKSLYDLIQKTTVPQCQEYRTMLEALIIKDRIRNGISIKVGSTTLNLPEPRPERPPRPSERRPMLHVGTSFSRDPDQVGRNRAGTATSIRQRRQHRLLGPKKGLAVHFGHENWNMVLSMMIGIRMAVGRSENEMKRELQPVDFIMKDSHSGGLLVPYSCLPLWP